MSPSHGVEVADILRQCGPEYRESHRLPRNQMRAMHAIEVCRSAALGGHRDQCDGCGHVRASYNSCRNRHCPKCQFLKKAEWIEARSKELLPIHYFHVVFTIPSELNPLVLRNQKILYNLLFRSVSETLMELGKDRIGARIGFISILHTWGQNLMDHPHIHCIVTGGGLSPDKKRWIASRKGFLIHVRVLSALFRGKFLAYLKGSYESGKLIFPGVIAPLGEPRAFKALRRRLYQKEWVVYCKAPFNGAPGVLKYLGRYTHRIAISNDRILTLEDDRVSFRWRDYADDNKRKVMTLEASEFIRRFLLHVLPDRFVKIRHFGIVANRKRRENIALCRELLGGNAIESKKDDDTPETWQERLLKVAGVDVTQCPVCQKGKMRRIEELQPVRCNGPPVRHL